nr:MAG TPA: hypothetical protein [Caudoviricetes sp.]
MMSGINSDIILIILNKIIIFYLLKMEVIYICFRMIYS